MNDDEKKCREIQQLLTRQSLGTIPESGRERVAVHLPVCDHCRRFAAVLAGMGSTLAADREKARPAPVVRERLFGIHSRGLSLSTARLKFTAFLRYRIPVYQALVAAGVVLILICGGRRLAPQDARPNRPPTAITLTDEGALALRNLEWVVEQKIGRSIEEDTLVTHWLYRL